MTHTDLKPSEVLSRAAFPLSELVDELNFVIAERRATIKKIGRERSETAEVKAIRIRICEDMIARTEAARDIIKDASNLAKAEGC